jgi:hypothetical protein
LETSVVRFDMGHGPSLVALTARTRGFWPDLCPSASPATALKGAALQPKMLDIG